MCVSLSVIVVVCLCLCVCVNLMGIPQRKCSAQAQKDRKGQRQQAWQGWGQERGHYTKRRGNRGMEGTQLARAQVKTCSLFVLTEALKHMLIVLTLRQRKCCILQGQRIVCITVCARQWVRGGKGGLSECGC